jgi:hypothetical protein
LNVQESGTGDFQHKNGSTKNQNLLPFVSISSPEIAELNRFDQFSENPESYLSMADEAPVFGSQDEPLDPAGHPEWPAGTSPPPSTNAHPNLG